MIDSPALERLLLTQTVLLKDGYPLEIPEINVEDANLDETFIAKLVASQFPSIVRDGASVVLPIAGHVDPYSTLKTELDNSELNIAVTPKGNADSPVGEKLFIKPYTKRLKGQDFFALLEHKAENIVCYAQSQDDNLHSEFSVLNEKGLIPTSVAQADAILGKPEATNVWIGDSRTVSRLHNDNYENLYFQLTGCKVVYLISPGDVYGVNERFLVPSRYRYNEKDSTFSVVVEVDPEFEAKNEENALELLDSTTKVTKVLFPTLNPAEPENFNDVFRMYGTVYKVVLNPGDMLYLPPLWYHQVEIIDRSAAALENISVSVNYWYGPSPTSPVSAFFTNTRTMALLLHGQYDSNYFDD